MRITPPMYAFFILCLFFQNSNAHNVNEASIVEIENRAIQLSKIWNEQEISRSIELFLEASEKWKELGRREKTAFCLRNAVELSFLISDHDKSLERLEEALRLDEKNKNLDGQVISNTLLFRAYTLVNQKKKGDAHINKAIKLSESSGMRSKAYAHYHWANYLMNFGDNKKAQELLFQALTFVETSDDLNLKTDILRVMGLSLAISGKKSEALEKISEAKTILQVDGDERQKAFVLNAFAFVYVVTDEKQKAREYYLKAKDLFPENVDFREKANTYGGLASIYFFYGDFLLAEKTSLVALELNHESGDKVAELAVLNELGQLYFLTGQKAKSKKFREQVSILSKKVNSPFYSAVLNEYEAIIDLTDGNTYQAITKLKSVLNEYEKNDVRLPRIRNLLGKAYEQTGDMVSAMRYYSSAEKINREINDSLGLAENLYNRARLLNNVGKLKSALELSKESISLTDSVYNDVSNNGLRETFLSNSYDRYELQIDLLMKLHKQQPENGFDVEAFQVSEKARARLMREKLHFADADLTFDADSDAVKKEIDLNSQLVLKKQDLTSLLADKNRSSVELDELNIEIAVLKDQLHNIKAVLRRNSPMYSALKSVNDLNLENFQQDILDKDTILLEFFFGKETSYVWLIGKFEFTTFEIPKAENIDSKIDELHRLLSSYNDTDGSDFETSLKESKAKEESHNAKARVLSQSLFGKIAKKLKNKRLIIVPDGKLRYFPVSALPNPAEEPNTPFLKTNEIVYIPSASMLYLLKSERKIANNPNKDILVYSDAVFQKNDERIDTNAPTRSFISGTRRDGSTDSDKDLERLPSSAVESNSIFDHFSRSNSKQVDGFDANRDNLLNENLADFKIIHFATHGVFDEKIPELSRIVLSQFDEKGTSQNGSIWLQDIHRLKLRSDLVVLSACDTGIGEEVKGEGLQSLTNGFLQAGTKSVISSRWKVGDQATVELMNHFYQIIAEENVSASKALWKAKLRMMKNPNYRNPYFWASFTIHGDFEVKPNLSRPFNYRNIGYFIAPLILFFAAFMILKSKRIRNKNSI